MEEFRLPEYRALGGHIYTINSASIVEQARVVETILGKMNTGRLKDLYRVQQITFSKDGSVTVYFTK